MSEEAEDSGEIPAPAQPGASEESVPGTLTDRPGRPVFARLEVDSSLEEPVVEVTLTIGDRRLVGRAVGPATGDASPRTAALATLVALRELLPAGVDTELGWLDVVDDPLGERPRVANSGLHCTTPQGTQTLLGSALAAGDLRVAAVRATLDGLNRILRVGGGRTATP